MLANGEPVANFVRVAELDPCRSLAGAHDVPIRALWIGALSRKIKCYAWLRSTAAPPPPAFVGRNPASSRRRLDVAGNESQRQHNPEEPNSHQ